MAGDDLSERGAGALTSHFLLVSETSDVREEPVLLGSKDGVSYVHERSNWALVADIIVEPGSGGSIASYNEREFFEKYGDGSDLVTVEEYRAERDAISGLRDGAMHKAADLYNRAIELGYVPSGEKIEYSGTKNYGRIERELNYKLQQDHEIPEVVVGQINELRGRSSDLKHRENVMGYRLRDIDNDIKEACLDLGVSEHSRNDSVCEAEHTTISMTRPQ